MHFGARAGGGDSSAKGRITGSFCCCCGNGKKRGRGKNPMSPAADAFWYEGRWRRLIGEEVERSDEKGKGARLLSVQLLVS